MHNKVRKILSDHFNKEEVALERPRNKSHGHFATPIAFALAKELRKNPMMIAEEIAKEFESHHMFERVEPIKGYVNFKLSDSYLNEYATWVLEHEEEFGKSTHEESILLEYVSANPTGPLHIGHARGAVYGDVLFRLGKHLGYKIDSEYYVNDAGNQIHLLGLSIYLAGREHILKVDVEYPEQYYRGEYIIELAQEAASDLGETIFESESSIDQLSLYGKEKMLEEIQSNLAECGITFDSYISEKGLYSQWPEIQKTLEKNNALFFEGEKIWLKSSEHGDEKDRVVVRDNGDPTYLAGDIIYHNHKYARKYDRYINIWGADHHGYINRVKAAIKFLGYDESSLEILLSQMVSLLKGGEPYKMSKRAGNFILMRDVVEDIGADALRFVFLSKKPDTHLEFDVDELKKTDSSNPVYYINYAHARIYSIFEKAEKSFDSVQTISLSELDEDSRDLLFQALVLPQMIEDAFSTRQPNKLTDYLKALAAQFHKFYYDHKVIGTENEDKYLKIFSVVALSIRSGLRLLGMSALNKM